MRIWSRGGGLWRVRLKGLVATSKCSGRKKDSTGGPLFEGVLLVEEGRLSIMTGTAGDKRHRQVMVLDFDLRSSLKE